MQQQHNPFVNTGLLTQQAEYFIEPAISLEELQKEPHQEIQNEGSEDTNGPPPGFSGPPRYLILAVRHSPRLKAKNQGAYITIKEKARQVSKLGMVGFSAKAKTKMPKPKKVPLDYLKSYDPLSSPQAEEEVAN